MSNPNEMPDGESVQDKIGHSIANAIAEADNGFVIKWVAVVEVIDGEGDRGLWTFTSDDAKRWDVFGMLEELKIFQTARMIANDMRGD